MTMDKDLPVRRRADISSVVAARIVQYLAEGKMPVGTHIPTQDLADRFAVSRSPINEALKLLSKKGLVSHRPNKGYFVSAVAPATPEHVGLAVEDKLSSIYFRIAEDRLSGAACRSGLRKLSATDLWPHPRTAQPIAQPHWRGGLGRAAAGLWVDILHDADDAGGARANLSDADGDRACRFDRTDVRIQPESSRSMPRNRGVVSLRWHRDGVRRYAVRTWRALP